MTPREKAQELLAEALALHHGPSYFAGLMDVTIIGETPEYVAHRLFADVPALAAALELGVAWQMAEAALPEGWAVNLLWGTITEERWGANAGPFPAKAGYSGITAGGSTPDEALAALATALVNGSAGADDTEGAAK